MRALRLVKIVEEVAKCKELVHIVVGKERVPSERSCPYSSAWEVMT
ncbi:MAG: hypothetical protein FWD30_01570 [Dehalococcoidia bacterium]|nr:hypothetical protein [Dehalococcoidia bacterium]